MTNLQHYNKAKRSDWTYQPELRKVTIEQMEVGKTYFDTRRWTGERSVILKLIEIKEHHAEFKNILNGDRYLRSEDGLIRFGNRIKSMVLFSTAEL